MTDIIIIIIIKLFFIKLNIFIFKKKGKKCKKPENIIFTLFKCLYTKRFKVNKIIKEFINFNFNFLIYNKAVKSRQPFLKIKIKTLLKIKLIKKKKKIQLINIILILLIKYTYI